MALYHFEVTQVKRSEGRSVVAAAAYRSGEKLTLLVILRNQQSVSAGAALTLDPRPGRLRSKKAFYFSPFAAGQIGDKNVVFGVNVEQIAV